MPRRPFMKEAKIIIMLSEDATKRRVSWWILNKFASQIQEKQSFVPVPWRPTAELDWKKEHTWFMNGIFNAWHKVAILLPVYCSCRIVLHPARGYFMQQDGNDSASNARSYGRVFNQPRLLSSIWVMRRWRAISNSERWKAYIMTPGQSRSTCCLWHQRRWIWSIPVAERLISKEKMGCTIVRC